jgi:hypothetical protein
VLVLVCAGFTNGRIAERIGSSEQVVKNRMREILYKSGRSSRSELIVFVFRHGVVECPCRRRGQLSGQTVGDETQARVGEVDVSV